MIGFPTFILVTGFGLAEATPPHPGLLKAGVTPVATGSSPAAAALRVTFIGNAAVHVTDGEVAVITDFPYESGAFGYMTWSKDQVPEGAASLCLISHAHADHFAPELVSEYCASVLGPRSVTRAAGAHVLQLEPEVRWKDVTIRSYPTAHGSVEHYSLLLEWKGLRLFFAGDTEDPEAILAPRNLDMAFVTPWLLEAVRSQGRSIDARDVVVYHHRTDETVPDVQQRKVPTQGEVLSVKVSGSLAGIPAAIAAPPGRVEFLNSGKVLPTDLPFSEAIRVGDMLYLSGQIGIVPGTMTLVPGGLKAEARQTMENIRTTLEAHGLAMRNLVKCTVMLADMSEWGAFNDVYKTYFAGRYPARSALGANGLALGARVEVECMAAISE